MKHIASLSLFAALSLLSAGSVLAAATIEYGPKYYCPSEELVTPHLAWAKPASDGPVKALFIIWRGGMREIVELSQRMDLEYTCLPTADAGKFCEEKDDYNPGWHDLETTTNDAEQKLKDSYDVIVMANVNWSCFPLMMRYWILKKVKEGTPLIAYVNTPDDYLKRATAKKAKFELPALVPFKGLPAFSKQADTAAFLNATCEYSTFGKGKIFMLRGFGVPSKQALTPGPQPSILGAPLVDYDYYLAYVCHLLQFAAGKGSAVTIKGNDFRIADRSLFTSVDFTVTATANKTVTCAFALRNKDNQVCAAGEKSVPIGPSDSTVTFQIPAKVPAGEYYADLWVKEGSKVAAFGSCFVQVTGDAAIAALDLDKKDFRIDEKVSGKVAVTSKKALDGATLKIQQRDSFGRIVARIDVPVPALADNGKQEVLFELLPGTPVAIVQSLDVELVKSGEALDRRSTPFSLSNLPVKDDIRFLAWVGAAPSYPAYYFFGELYDAGFDTQYTGFGEVAPMRNLRHLPYATRFIDTKTDWYPHPSIPSRDKDDHVRAPCLTDPAYLATEDKKLTDYAKKASAFSSIEYSMGDECHFVAGHGELCFSPTCVAAFHKFLAAEYGTVEVMNKEYGSTYAAFDQVQPVTLSEVRKDAKLGPLWVDFRRHMESNWANIYQWSTDVIRKVQPEAKVGYEGSNTEINSFGAADFYKLMKVLRVNGTYDGAFVPYAVMNFAQPGTLLGLGWYGGYNESRCADYQRYIAWRHLFRGANSYWVWTMDPGSGSTTTPDLSLYDYFKANVREVNEIQRGAGKLLMKAQREDDGIAILYSASSVHAATLTEELPQMEAVLNSLVPLLEDTSNQFRVVSYEQVAEGILGKGGFRVLLLPYVQAMSPKEAQAILAFASNGGAVIADLRPAVRDEHGRPADKGMLDDMFGVEQVCTAAKPAQGDVTINDAALGTKIAKTYTDASIKVTTGQAKAALGTTPALIVKEHGKGKAILLNFSFAGYAGVKGGLENSAVKGGEGEEAAARRAFCKALLASVGVQEKLKITPEVPGLRTYRFRKDHLQYLGLLQELPEDPGKYTAGEARPLVTTPATVTLPAKCYVYNVRTGKFVGHTDKIETPVAPSEGRLFALLPYKLKDLDIDAPKKVHPGDTFTFEVTLKGVDQPGMHVLHAALVSPQGQEFRYYTDNVVAEAGKAKGSFPLALNEAPGKWKLRVRDVATGADDVKAFTVEEVK